MKFYGAVFKFQKFGISIRDDGYMYDRYSDCENCNRILNKNPSTICIESPEDMKNDAGRSTFRFIEVCQAFRGILGLLGTMSWEKKGTTFLYEIFQNDKDVRERTKRIEGFV